MKCARIHAFGGPDVIRLDEVDLPRPKSGEVRVRIEASSVNPVDYKIRKGGYLPESALPIALGRDVSGVVDALGEGVEALSVGDAVMAMLPMEVGGNAEFAAAPAVIFARRPERLGREGAAALGLAALTAWQGLFDHGGLASGQSVLIHGAAGGVGHLAVQFARARGAEVFATCSGGDMDFVRGLGAEPIDYRSERFEDRTPPVDLVFDLIGGETQTRSFDVLKRGGTLVSTLTEPDPERARRDGVRGVHYMARPNGAQLEEIRGLADRGAVTPTIDRELPLTRLAEAHRALEEDHVRGKIVIRI